MIRGLHHPAVTTVDLEGMIRFYGEHFGCELVWRTDPDCPDVTDVGGALLTRHIAFLRAGRSFIELFEYVDPPAVPGASREVNESGLLHLAFDVVGMNEEYERLLRAGVRFTCPPIDVGVVRFCFALDPEGNTIELLEVLDESLPFHAGAW